MKFLPELTLARKLILTMMATSSVFPSGRLHVFSELRRHHTSPQHCRPSR